MTAQKDFEELIEKGKFSSIDPTGYGAQLCYALALQMAEQAYNAGYDSCADSINKLTQPKTFQDYLNQKQTP